MPALPPELWLDIISWAHPVDAWNGIRGVNRSLRNMTETVFRQKWVPDTIIEVYGDPKLDFKYDEHESKLSGADSKVCFRWQSEECAQNPGCPAFSRERYQQRHFWYDTGSHGRAHLDHQFRSRYVEETFSRHTFDDCVYVVHFGGAQLENESCLLNDCCLADAIVAYGLEMQIWVDWKKMFSTLFFFHATLAKELNRRLDPTRATVQIDPKYPVGSYFHTFQSNLFLLHKLIRRSVYSVSLLPKP